MKRRAIILQLCAAVITVFLSQQVFAAAEPSGVWKTISSEGVAKSNVRIAIVNGELRGKVTKLLPGSGESQNAVCKKCQGENQNKPIVGMVVLWGFHQEGDTWKGGKILDVGKGKIYNAEITPDEAGTVLNVHIYSGILGTGKTVHWQRVQ